MPNAPETVFLLLPLAIFATVTSITPGPNNILLTASGANFGFRRTVPHMIGISIGFLSLIIVSGLGVGALVAATPWLHGALKIIGAGYLVWLAWQLARAGTSESSRPFECFLKISLTLPISGMRLTRSLLKGECVIDPSASLPIVLMNVGSVNPAFWATISFGL